VRIETLPGDAGSKQKPKRVGRGEGSGNGKTCGRGHKGFQSRSGSTKRLGDEGGQMPLLQRLPKRGFTPLQRREFAVVNVGGLERFEAGATVDPETLRSTRLARRKDLPVKILAQGDLSKSLTVRAHAFSAGARKKIEAAGGTCEVVPMDSVRRTAKLSD
jgi:large subunit ribosomal protein L15